MKSLENFLISSYLTTEDLHVKYKNGISVMLLVFLIFLYVTIITRWAWFVHAKGVIINVNWGTDNTMIKRNRTKGQTIIYTVNWGMSNRNTTKHSCSICGTLRLIYAKSKEISHIWWWCDSWFLMGNMLLNPEVSV
jgi:hypothetical protein